MNNAPEKGVKMCWIKSCSNYNGGTSLRKGLEHLKVMMHKIVSILLPKRTPHQEPMRERKRQATPVSIGFRLRAEKNLKWEGMNKRKHLVTIRRGDVGHKDTARFLTR